MKCKRQCLSHAQSLCSSVVAPRVQVLGQELKVAARWTYVSANCVSGATLPSPSRELARAVLRADAILVASLVSLPGSRFFCCCSGYTLRNFLVSSGFLLFCWMR